MNLNTTETELFIPRNSIISYSIFVNLVSRQFNNSDNDLIDFIE